MYNLNIKKKNTIKVAVAPIFHQSVSGYQMKWSGTQLFSERCKVHIQKKIITKIVNASPLGRPRVSLNYKNSKYDSPRMSQSFSKYWKHSNFLRAPTFYLFFFFFFVANFLYVVHKS